MKYCLLLLVSLLPVYQTRAQVSDPLPFTVEVVEVTFPGLPGLHSGAAAQAGGRWLFVGGRTNGLHGFRENPFPRFYANGDLWVVDPVSRTTWSASLDALPDSLADPLRAANAQFYQDGDRLYVVGGFGDDSATLRQRTFATLTAIDVPETIEAVVRGEPFAGHVRQLVDDRLRVTGGVLERLGDRFYLLFGHHFDGYYSRDPSTFFQAYTEEVRSFLIEDDGQTLRLAEYAAQIDTAQFHRRDLNAAPVIFPGERPGLAAYGGVFTPDTDLPYLHPVYVDGGTAAVDTTFEQRMSQYTCPLMPLFDPATGTMHTVFFGGLGLYYMDEASGTLRRDDNIPFTDDVTALSRRADGGSSETVLPVRLPALLGSNAYLLPADGVPRYPNGVVRLDALAGRVLVGHLFGGIEAALPNAGTSRASTRLFEVYVSPAAPTAVAPGLPRAVRLDGPWPNPFASEARLVLTPDRPEAVTFEVFNVLGQRVLHVQRAQVAAGEAHVFTFAAGTLPGGLYLYRLSGQTFQTSGRLVLAR